MSIGPASIARPGATPTPDDAARLKKTASQLEGLFVQRMFAAMRDSVPEGGLVPQSSAEGTFTQLLDEKVSEQVPSQWSGAHSLANALYHQLRQRLASQAGDASAPAAK